MTPQLARVLFEAHMPDLNQEQALHNQLLEAKACVHKFMVPSPLRKSEWLSELTGAEVYLKLECLNPNGSFKVRGALCAIANRLARRAAGVHPSQKGALNSSPTATLPLKICAASAGNHAQGVAFAAHKMGCEAHIFLPKRTPLVKLDATERLGARVYLVGDVLEEAFEAAVAFADAQQAEFLHAFNDFEIILGQGSCALEVLDQFPEVSGTPGAKPDVFLCSIGGGGLASGAGLAFHHFSPGTKVVGVEQEFFDSAARSMHENSQMPVTKTGLTSLADGIAVKTIGNINYALIKAYVEGVLLTSDNEIVSALLGLCEREHVVSEGAGAAPLAALLKHASQFAGKRVVVCVSGGNIDPQLLSRVIARGLGVTGRVLRLTARLCDRPGQLKALLEEIALSGANVLEVHHDRTYGQVNVGDVEVELALETRSFEHQYELLERLEEQGFKPKIRNG